MSGGEWNRLLERYGERVSLCRGEKETPVRAFFQPVREKKDGEEPTALGMAPRGSYLYLGPAGEALEGVEELAWKGRLFRLLRWRAFPVGGETQYLWGLFEEWDEKKEAVER